MKINSSPDMALPISPVGGGKLDRGTASSQSGVTGGPDKPATARGAGVAFKTSSAFRALGAVSEGSGIDPVKVAAVRAAIANGTFGVSAERIADKLLSNAQELLDRN